MSTEKNTIKNWFKTGLKPTQAQFWATWDSFWHKDEKLPISSIENLGNLIDGKAEANHSHAKYATNSATSLTPENVTQWQNKLGVADLKFDDQAITTTQDYAEFGLDSGATINAFNNAIYSEVLKKLNAPSENNTSDYVLLADGSTAPQTDFGKVDKVMGIAPDVDKNVDISGVAMNWTNSSQQFSGLVDKSADATFNVFPVFDSNGALAKVSQIANAFERGLKGTTSEQALRIGQLLNGGQGSSGVINVNMISPPMIQNTFNSEQYVLLRGANLLLNILDMSISICDSSKNVIEKIPNNQIINNSPTELVFYYNFYNFAVGDYFIKITSGVKVYYTTLELKVIQEIQNINLNNITWEVVTKEGVTTNPDNKLEGSNFLFTSPIGATKTIVDSYKSSELFAPDEDFYLELEVSWLSRDSAGQPEADKSNIGITYSDTANNIINNMVIGCKWSITTGSIFYVVSNSKGDKVVGNVPITTQSIIIIKTGNLLRVGIGSTNYSITVSENKGYSITVQNLGRPVACTVQGQITRAFKFN